MTIAWTITGGLLLLGIVPTTAPLLRGRDVADALVALQSATLVAALTVAALAIGLGHGTLIDVALAVVAIAAPSGLLLARVAEGWWA